MSHRVFWIPGSAAGTQAGYNFPSYSTARFSASALAFSHRAMTAFRALAVRSSGVISSSRSLVGILITSEAVKARCSTK